MKLRPHEGFAVVTVIFILTIFASMGMAAVALLSGSAKRIGDEYRSQQAFEVAQAGVFYTAKTLASDADWSDNAGFTKNFGPGSFTISFPSKTATTATIQSDGTVGGITRSIRQGVTKGGGEVAFTKAFYTESDITMSGSSSGEIDGDVSAGGAINDSSAVTVTGDQQDGNTNANVPDPLWSYWQSVATTTISGGYNFGSGTYSGVYYVDGNVTFSKNVTLNGTLVARGSVTMTGNENITINAVSPNPAIIAEGAILFSGTSDVAINGWVITLSTLTMTGTTGVTAEGGFIAAGDITLTGNSDTEVTYVTPVPGGGPVPGFTGGEVGNAVVFGLWSEHS